MYHRIGWVVEPSAKIPAISPRAQIEHVAGSGWVISDGGHEVEPYPNQRIRISILWKGRIRADGVRSDDNQLTDERIVEIFETDLLARGVGAKARASPLSDQAWLDCVRSTSYARSSYGIALLADGLRLVLPDRGGVAVAKRLRRAEEL